MREPDGYSGDMLSPYTVIAKSTFSIGDIIVSQSFKKTLGEANPVNEPPIADIGSR